MLKCKKLNASLPGHQIINAVVTKPFVCCNIHTLHAQPFAKNVLMGFSNFNLHFSYINIALKRSRVEKYVRSMKFGYYKPTNVLSIKR